MIEKRRAIIDFDFEKTDKEGVLLITLRGFEMDDRKEEEDKK